MLWVLRVRAALNMLIIRIHGFKKSGSTRISSGSDSGGRGVFNKYLFKHRWALLDCPVLLVENFCSEYLVVICLVAA